MGHIALDVTHHLEHVRSSCFCVYQLKTSFKRKKKSPLTFAVNTVMALSEVWWVASPCLGGAHLRGHREGMPGREESSLVWGLLLGGWGGGARREKKVWAIGQEGPDQTLCLVCGVLAGPYHPWVPRSRSRSTLQRSQTPPESPSVRR